MKTRILVSIQLVLMMACATGQKSSGIKGSSDSDEKSDSRSIEEIHIEAKKYTFDNGLKLIVVENHRLPIVSYYTFYDVGGKYEGPGTTGATHFLEHMMFRGSEKFPPGVFDRSIEASGGNTNAYTTFDSTVYYQNIPTSMLPKIIEMEADRMENLVLNPELVEKERKVVFEERKYRYENSPQGKLYLKMMQSVFEGTPYGGSVIGDVADLEAINIENLYDFYKKFYTPDNATIVVAGDVSASQVKSLVKKHMGHMKASSKEIQAYKKKKDRPELFTHQARYGRSIKIKGNNPAPLFMIAYKGEKLGTRRGFVMDILSSVIGDGDSSYLHQKLVKGRRPLLTSIGAANYTLRNNGVFFLSGEFLDKKSFRSQKRKVFKVLSKVCNEAITERNIQKTKNQYLIGYFSEIKTNRGIAHFLGTRENVFGDYNYYQKELDIYNSITTEEVKEACNEIFKSKDYIALSIWNRN